MTERPILFSGPMVRALLDGRKTQTRRIVKPQPSDYRPETVAPQKLRGEPPKHDRPYFDAYNGGPHWCWWDQYNRQGRDWIKCPYGIPGDTLWVRETWGLNDWKHGGRNPIPKTRPVDLYADALTYRATEDDPEILQEMPFRPSIHMPRWASRLTLTITEVRVERLQDISDPDAEAEGVQIPALVPILGAFWSSRDGYARLWEHINGKGSWAANPWVWGVTFDVKSA